MIGAERNGYLMVKRETVKAYKAYSTYTEYSVVVFAENANKAKSIAMNADGFEYERYIDMRAERLPNCDEFYKGKQTMDWYNDEDRRALVSLGWHCKYVDEWMCIICCANDICEEYARLNERRANE